MVKKGFNCIRASALLQISLEVTARLQLLPLPMAITIMDRLTEQGGSAPLDCVTRRSDSERGTKYFGRWWQPFSVFADDGISDPPWGFRNPQRLLGPGRARRV